MTQARSVTATFGVATFVLDVTRAGMGGGTVSSVPAGINCPGDCSETYAYNTSVVLTATPDANSDFAGWSGSGCTGTGTCTVTMTQARSVTATFDRKPRTLSIKFSGNGAGTVTANGQSCTSTCNLTFPHGTAITMSATASTANATQSTFMGWAGAGCSGTGGCSFTITAATTVDATFRLDPNLMFTSSATYNGNLGGLAGADAKCQALAQAAGRRGTYRAYLGATTGDAKSRFTGASAWTRVDGLPIVNAIGDFGTVLLPNAPVLDESGNDLTQSATTFVWTASNADTTYAGASCQTTSPNTDWTDPTSKTYYGICTYKTSTVILNKPTGCNQMYRLYCFGTDRAATLP
jgi:hypothetical protein